MIAYSIGVLYGVGYMYLKNRFKRWYKWQKNCLNHPFYKFLVLFGLAKSPTFHIFSSIEESTLAHPELTIQYREES